MSWKPVGSLAKLSRIAAVAPSSRTDLGNVTLEVSATTLPAKIYANEGASQMLFFQSDERCEVSYKDRKCKYQGQRGATLPRP